MVSKLKGLLEQQAFGVCTYLGDRIGITTSNIRLFFVYSSFLTLGSPIIIYLSLAFLINLRQYAKRRKRNPIWDF